MDLETDEVGMSNKWNKIEFFNKSHRQLEDCGEGQRGMSCLTLYMKINWKDLFTCEK